MNKKNKNKIREKEEKYSTD